MPLRRFRAGFLIFLGLTVSTLASASSRAAQNQAKPVSAEDHLKRGNELRSKNDWDGAIAEYREALRHDPKNGDAHYNLGVALGRKGDLTGEIAEFGEALRLNPKNAPAQSYLAEAHYELGVRLEAKGDVQGALNEYRAAHSLNPQNPAFGDTIDRLQIDDWLRRHPRFWPRDPALLRTLPVLAALVIIPIGVAVVVWIVSEVKTWRPPKPAPPTVASPDSAQWQPPQELMLPTPRPIKAKRWWSVTARHVGIVGGGLLFLGGIALPGWVFLAAPQAPGATIGAKWQQFAESAPYLWYLSLIIYGMFFVSFWPIYFSCRKEAWLLRWGEPAHAVVIGVVRTSGYKSSGSFYYSILEYQDRAGNLVRGKEVGELPRGQVLTVLYNPNRPAIFIVYPPGEYKIGEPESP